MQLSKQDLIVEFITETIGLPTLSNKQAERCAEICHRQIRDALKTDSPIDEQLKQLGYNPESLELRGVALINALKENVELKQKMKIHIQPFYDLLVGYMEWEAMLIEDNAMWWPNAPKDRISGKSYDKMMELQSKRNELLSMEIFAPSNENTVSVLKDFSVNREQ